MTPTERILPKKKIERREREERKTKEGSASTKDT